MTKPPVRLTGAVEWDSFDGELYYCNSAAPVKHLRIEGAGHSDWPKSA